MLEWLLGLGVDVEATDEFGLSALGTAGEQKAAACLQGLGPAGAGVDREHDGRTALAEARSREVALALLDAGAAPRHLSGEGRRAIVGLPPEADGYLLDATPEDFARAPGRRFGFANPELFDEPFWAAMIRAGVSAYTGAQWLGA